MEVKPFKAFRYATDVVGDVGGCISPPYDVISPAQQEQLYDKNISRLPCRIYNRKECYVNYIQFRSTKGSYIPLSGYTFMFNLAISFLF